MKNKFDDYFFGVGFASAACKAVAEAVEQARAAGLPIEGYASNPAAPAFEQSGNAIEPNKGSIKGESHE